MAKNLEILLQGLDVLEIRGDLQTQVNGLAYDSRQIGDGDLFVAIRGTRQDGNQFVGDAVRRGARVVVVESLPEDSGCATFVKVPDCRNALARMAANYYEHPSRDIQLIGVTGTNGKTTTTLLIESILQKGGASVGVLGTLGYRWGSKRKDAPMTTPESLDLQRFFYEMRQDGVSHVVMEVSSHALALGRVDGCVFRAGVFTNLSQDHLDFHSTMEDYFAAKAILFRDPSLSCGENFVAVINGDDPFGVRFLENPPQNGLWSYSALHKDARVWVKDVTLSPAGIHAELSTPLGNFRIRSHLIGRLNLYNLLCAATTALALGYSKEAVADGLEAVSHVDGRLQRVPVPRERGYEVVVDYAHTPDAMEKSLNCLREMTRGRLWVVFGCGGDRDRTKRPLMGEVAAQVGDLVVITSDNPRSEVPESIIEQIEPGVRSVGLPCLTGRDFARAEKGYMIEPDRKAAIELALSRAEPGDVIFIGGKGHETYQIIGGKVHAFDDRSVVHNYFKTRGEDPPEDRKARENGLDSRKTR
ncbi:UDP-N-acetylmuramoyl-L-alanyl-D-glutamate--2,6-diaminopimelate ligase [Desulforhabdus amnigena]|nr:UDP-N-acetylmuramoyl-L-alanyl-D-glutamate--2,6-diaminopimelate ligase [Desulforhabdus amnigena]NLJ26747.1 UDP-N-acetylmuramoyl-L-alanyl-D-glutamate--2,6-diaminopimelate ligase [Deltaproteobacteria bacterium]